MAASGGDGQAGLCDLTAPAGLRLAGLWRPSGGLALAAALALALGPGIAFVAGLAGLGGLARLARLASLAGLADLASFAGLAGLARLAAIARLARLTRLAGLAGLASLACRRRLLLSAASGGVPFARVLRVGLAAFALLLPRPASGAASAFAGCGLAVAPLAAAFGARPLRRAGHLRLPAPALEGHPVDDAAHHDAEPQVEGPELPDLPHAPVLADLGPDVGGAALRPEPHRGLLQAEEATVVEGEPALLLLVHLLARRVQHGTARGLVAQLAAPADHLYGGERRAEAPRRVVQLGVLR
mmetsp:Transcript_96386/g.254564  ORF Transcript_96386/g.254564 Transcript_96386/m.254564 type:complete len:299 (+) Transcript_96386:48-944(+)